MSFRDLWDKATGRGSLLSEVATGLLLVFSLVLVVLYTWSFIPWSQWILWRYLGHFFAASLFLTTCFGLGLFLVERIDRGPHREDERVVLALGLGVLGSFLLIFVSGLLGLLGGTFFFVLPLVQGGIGALPLRRLIKRRRRARRRFGRPLIRARGALDAGALLLGFVGCVLLYAQLATPHNLGADTHWYHLPIAENYATSGEIRPSASGWYPGAYPQLANLIYTWAFCLPFGLLVDKTFLVSHLEFVFLLATLGSVGVLVRRISGRGRFPYAGAALFLFPGIFVYDSNLIGAADHVLAFFVPPLGVALFSFLRKRSDASAIVLGLLLSACALTKSQGIYFVPFAALCALYVMLRHRTFRAPLVLAAVALAATSPHWLKNYLWYGDPVYPLLHSVFPSPGTYDGAMDLLPQGIQEPRFRFQGTTAEFFEELFYTSFDFAFVPHNWKPFHGDRPVFGFLYSLLLPVLLFQKGVKRTLLLALGVQIGLAVWFATFQQDRYLQTLLPWMTVVTVVALHRVWERGVVLRIGAALLVSYQLAWGADLPFLRTHAMAGGSPLERTLELAPAAHEGQHDKRLRLWGFLQDAGKELPEDAFLLIHDVQERLGVGVPSVSDRLRWQSRIHHARVKTIRDAAKQIRTLQTSHVLWTIRPSLFQTDDLANEAAFADLVRRYAGEAKAFKNYRLAEWKEIDPGAAPARPLEVAVYSCDKRVKRGIYEVGKLARGKGPETPSLRKASHSDAVLIEAGCQRGRVPSAFSKFATFNEWQVWARNEPNPE